MSTSMTTLPDIEHILQQIGQLPGSYIFMALTFLVIAGLGLYTMQQKQLRRKREQIVQQKAMEAMRSKIQSQSSAMLLLSERVNALEEYLELVGSRQQRMEQGKHNLQHSYQDAIKIANGGAGSEELVTRCGLSNSEADLISLLYGKAS